MRTPERCDLVLFVKFRFAKSMNSNTLRRPLNLFEFPHSSFVFSVGFNRSFRYSTKEPGSSDILIHFYTRGSSEWR